MSAVKTTFGPFQRLTILTSNAIVMVTGHNMLASFSFHKQKAGHRGFPPLSAVQCVNEVEKFGEDSSASGTNREGFFDLTETDASSEDSSVSNSPLLVHLTSLLPQHQTLTEAMARRKISSA